MSVQPLTTLPGACATVIDKLAQSLCETRIETSKAQTYHWNVVGMAFGPLHALFQEIYEDHFSAQDELAERMRAMGNHVDGRLTQALKHSSIAECAGTIPARDMVKILAHDQRTLSATLIDLAKIADERGDIVTNDLAIQRANIHDKFAWMLSAHLAD